MKHEKVTKKGAATVLALLLPTAALLAQWPSPADADAAGAFASRRETDAAETVAQPDPLAARLARAHRAVRAGDLRTAVTVFEDVRGTAFPWHAWAAASSLVATYRMVGNFAAAYAETARIRAARPRLADLMSVWDGDTARLAGELAIARGHYRRAADATSRDVAALALQQLARVALVEGAPGQAARHKRALVRRFPDLVSPELTLAEAMVYDAMATDSLPIVALSVLLHEAVCTERVPCVLRNGRREPAATGPGKAPGERLADLSGFRFHLSSDDRRLLDDASDAARRPEVPNDSILTSVCTPARASDGFEHSMPNHHTGYAFMDEIGGGRCHPGIDLNGPGRCNDDCGTVFVAVARGCVRDVSPSDWGAATVEHFYIPATWVSQYGHAGAIYYSAGAAISKGAALGRVDRVGTACCHLHHELREADHPYRTHADYYSNLPRDEVGDWYQDPLRFHDAHRSYTGIQWADEGAFSRFGAWSYVSGVGDGGDMRWAPTTSTGSGESYARYAFRATHGGVHELWAFVPYDHATSRRARYRLVRKLGGTPLLARDVDQLAHADAWVRLGTVSLTRGSTYEVEVGGQTGESGARVALDDILIIRP